MKWFPLLTLCALFSFIAQAGNGNPENLVAYGQKILVSHMGQTQDSSEDGDGYISLHNAKGEVLVEKYLPAVAEEKLDSPMGITVFSDVVYVADVRRVVGYSLLTRRQVFEASVDDLKTEYLNDLIVLSRNQLLVTSTTEKRVLTLDLVSKKWSNNFAQENLGFVNGITYDSNDKALYISHNRIQNLGNKNGFITAYNLSPQGPRKLWELNTGRFLDGLAFIGNQYILAADWGSDQLLGELHIVDRSKGTEVSLLKTTEVGLADAYFDGLNNSIVTVALRTGKIQTRPSPFPIAAQVRCANLVLNVDALGFARSLGNQNSSCGLGLYSQNSTNLWFTSTTPCPFGDLKVSKSNKWIIEIQNPREPHCTSRLCDPSTVQYETILCD